MSFRVEISTIAIKQTKQNQWTKQANKTSLPSAVGYCFTLKLAKQPLPCTQTHQTDLSLAGQWFLPSADKPSTEKAPIEATGAMQRLRQLDAGTGNVKALSLGAAPAAKK